MDINADVARIKQLEAEYQAAVAKYEADLAAQKTAQEAQAAAEAATQAAQAAEPVAPFEYARYQQPVEPDSAPVVTAAPVADDESYAEYMSRKPLRIEAQAVATSLANFPNKNHPTAQKLVARKSALAKLI